MRVARIKERWWWAFTVPLVIYIACGVYFHADTTMKKSAKVALENVR